jgi:uncharacterized membrane protein
MNSLILAALFFVGIHALISGTALRDVLVGWLGEKAYLGLFSLLSAGVLTWLIMAFGHARVVTPTPWPEYRWIAALLMFVAFEFIVLGVTTRGPTGVGGESALDQPDPARGIHRITRHPFLCGFALWAGTHLLFNPEPAALWFFGAFLALSLIGPALIDAKRAKKFGAKWQAYAAVTSALPFLAIAQGRNRLVFGELGVHKLIIAAVVYAGFAMLHARFFGIAPF